MLINKFSETIYIYISFVIMLLAYIINIINKVMVIYSLRG